MKRPFAPDPPDRPNATILFAELEGSLDRGDFDAAARAVRELRRLGIVVIYGRRPQTDREPVEVARG